MNFSKFYQISGRIERGSLFFLTILDLAFGAAAAIDHRLLGFLPELWALHIAGELNQRQDERRNHQNQNDVRRQEFVCLVPRGDDRPVPGIVITHETRRDMNVAISGA